MKVVTIGTSKITETNIAQMRMAGIEVYACISRDLNRAKDFAYKNHVERYNNDYDRVLKSKEFDFIYIGLPNSLHFKYAKKALENGKNVIIEKPMCLNQKEARELISIALSKHLFVFENMKTYHLLAYKTLKQDIELIKPIKMISLNFSKYSSKYDMFKANVPQTIFSLEYGSGALMDLNCYNISFVVGLFGLPLEATYICNKEKGVDVSGTAILKYKDFIVTAIAGKDTNANSYIDICGENGHIYSNTSSSIMDHYKIALNNKEIKEVNLTESYYFVPMLKTFKSIYENNNLIKYDELMKLSLMEMRVLDDLRKSANLIYKSE